MRLFVTAATAAMTERSAQHTSMMIVILRDLIVSPPAFDFTTKNSYCQCVKTVFSLCFVKISATCTAIVFHIGNKPDKRRMFVKLRMNGTYAQKVTLYIIYLCAGM